MYESQTEPPTSPSPEVSDTNIRSAGYLVVDREHYSVLRRNGDFNRLGESVKSSPAVYQFRDQALNALIDQTIKNPDLRAEVMDVKLDQRQKVLWPDDWLAARDELQAELRRLAEQMSELPESTEKPVGINDHVREIANVET